MSEWLVGVVLPNVDIRCRIGCKSALLVPHDDPLAIELRSEEKRLNSFLGKFKDAFGLKINPTLLLYRKDLPKTFFTPQALTSFRDAVSIATIVHNRALELTSMRGHRLVYSNSFWLYPWMLDKNNEHLVAYTDDMLAMHNVAKFKGQSSPEISRKTIDDSDIDGPLLTELLDRWEKCYSLSSRKVDWSNLTLFRSLNMANQAALMPSADKSTYFDYGRSIALWVSAFEILVHPKTQNSGLSKVYEVLERVQWKRKRASGRWFKVYERNATRSGMLACSLYGQIYRARNEFLHGNEVSRKNLMVARSQKSLFQCAAPLYRMALTGFLPLIWDQPIPSINDPKAFAESLSDSQDFSYAQRVIEEALIAAIA